VRRHRKREIREDDFSFASDGGLCSVTNLRSEKNAIEHFFTLSGMPLAGAKNLAVQQGCNGRILCKKVEIPLTFSGAAAQLQCNQNKGNIHRKSKTQTIRKANH